MQGTSPDDQILNQFARNQKMHIWKKYKTEILQIWSWQIQEYLNRDLAVRESRPCQHVSWFWFLPEEVQVTQSGGQLWKWSHLVVKFETNASDALWWPNLQLVQVAPSSGQICNSCKWRHLVAKFATNASGAIWWPKLKPMQVAPSGGQICN